MNFGPMNGVDAGVLFFVNFVLYQIKMNDNKIQPAIRWFQGKSYILLHHLKPFFFPFCSVIPAQNATTTFNPSLFVCLTICFVILRLWVFPREKKKKKWILLLIKMRVFSFAHKSSSMQRRFARFITFYAVDVNNPAANFSLLYLLSLLVFHIKQ